MRKTINERQLKRIITEAAKRAIREGLDSDLGRYDGFYYTDWAPDSEYVRISDNGDVFTFTITGRDGDICTIGGEEGMDIKRQLDILVEKDGYTIGGAINEMARRILSKRGKVKSMDKEGLRDVIKEAVRKALRKGMLRETTISSRYSSTVFRMTIPIAHKDVGGFLEMFNALDAEGKDAVYHYFADSSRIAPEFIKAMEQNM